MTTRVGIEDTRVELREMFDKWGMDRSEWDIEWDEELVGSTRRRLPGVTLRYWRQKQWQTAVSKAEPTRDRNLRQVFLFLDRVRKAEKAGVQYQGLSFTKEMARASGQTTGKDRREELLDAYDVVGVAPDDPKDVLDSVYNAKAKRFHPDSGGPTADAERFKRLTAARDLIYVSRGWR